MRQSDRDKLVTDNLRLVYYLYEKLRKTPLVMQNKDDLIAEGTVGLIKAANKFDPTKRVRFSTYASRCINNEMFMFLRKLNKQEANEVSLYKAVSRDTDGSVLTYADILPADSDTDTCVVAIAVDGFMSKQKDIDSEIMDALRQGYTQKEIATMVGLKQPTVSRRIRKLKNKFRKENPV